MQKLTPQIERMLRFWHCELHMSSQAAGRNHRDQKTPKRWLNADWGPGDELNEHEGFLPSWTPGQCLVPEGIIANTGCRREIASHWCDQPHWEGCYGSLWMEWLRTNGLCFPGAGMVKRALIECTEKGLFLNNGRIVHFVRGRADIQ